MAVLMIFGLAAMNVFIGSYVFTYSVKSCRGSYTFEIYLLKSFTGGNTTHNLVNNNAVYCIENKSISVIAVVAID